MKRERGTVRDAIIGYLDKQGDSSVAEIVRGVSERLGSVAPSSVRSYLRANVGVHFDRPAPGRYSLMRSRAGKRVFKPVR